MRSRLLLTGITLYCIPSSALSVVIHVNPEGTGDAPTIAAAYAMAVSGDDIELAPGTYHEHDIVMKSLVDLYGAAGDASTTIVDAQGLGRCLGVNVTGAPTIRDITFQNGVHAAEGGLLFAGQGGTGGGHNARYFDCVFRNGSAPRGGAVATKASWGSAPEFIRCTFESNVATSGDGGAIWTDGVGSLFDCAFRLNSASGHGGAIYSQKNFIDWGVRAQYCDFESNAANGDGGAIYSTGVTDMYGSSIESCTFADNTSSNGGAARLNQYDLVSSSTFFENVAIGDGGALQLFGIQPDKDNLGYYTYNAFGHNRAGSEGGALAIVGSSTFSLDHCTFALNEAPSGGHIWTSGSPTLTRCILAFAPFGAAAAGTASMPSSCTDVFGNGGGDFVGPLSSGGSVPSNLSADPEFCDAAADDLTLRDNSPCLPPNPCGLIGAYGLGCSAVSADAGAGVVSWGRIKAAYR